MFTLLEGDPGLGKSTAAIDIAARLTTGRPMPWADRPELPASNVLILSLEDSLAATAVPRLIAAGADLTRVTFWDHERLIDPDTGQDLGPRSPSFPQDIPALERHLTETGARLVIIDVLFGYINSKTDSYRDQDTRTITAPLKALAEELHFSILALRHYRKSRDGSAINAGGGSIGWAGAARSVLAVGRDPENDERAVLAVTKLSVAKHPDSLAFRLVSSNPTNRDAPARIEWDGPVDVTANDLVAQHREPSTKRDEIKAVITERMTNGPMDAGVMESTIRSLGYAKSTWDRARKELGIRSGRVKDGWVWYYPERQGPSTEQVRPCTDEGDATRTNAGRSQGLTPTASEHDETFHCDSEVF